MCINPESVIKNSCVQVGCSYELILDDDTSAVHLFWQRNGSFSSFKLCDVIFWEI